MPILPNAKKALRVSKRKKMVNQKIKKQVKTAFDKLKKTPTTEMLANVYSAIDKAIKKNIYHKNKGARLKSQASKLLKKS
jgi:small subunit ribosomal protein S20